MLTLWLSRPKAATWRCARRDDTNRGAVEARAAGDETLGELGLPLEELVRRGARTILQTAIEAEVQVMLEQFAEVSLIDGLRESTESWLDVLRDLKDRGLDAGPRLAVGDGALGFWSALDQVNPETRHQRCWFHKMGNVLAALPKSLQGKAKADLQAIWMAVTRKEAMRAFERFLPRYGAKYQKGAAKLEKDRDALPAFYDFPAEHWVHLRTTNPIESTFATVRHRTSRTKNCVTRTTFLGLAFKLAEQAAKTWRRIRAPEKVAELLGGARCNDGLPVTDDPPDSAEAQREAA